MTVRHAVLTNTHVLWISETARKLDGCKHPIHCQHISELWQVGRDLEVSHFWVMPGTPIDGMGYSFLSEKEGFDIFVSMGDAGENKPDRPRSARCTKDGYEIKIGYPGREPFGWTVNHPLDVLATIDYLEQVLPLTVQWSPQSMGERLLNDQYRATKRLQSYIRKPTIDMRPLPFWKASVSREIYFCPGPFTPDMVGKRIHVYDKNSAHPCAAAMMNTGSGDPVHLEGVGDIVPKNPGLYRVSFSSKGSRFDGGSLPKIIESDWVTLDIVKFAMKQGYAVQIHEAYVFEESHRLFEKWTPALWDARQSLKNIQRFPYEPARENAEQTVKTTLNFTVSSMKQHRNWYVDMVGAARVARFANMDKWAQQGYYPLYVYSDELGFVSDDANHETAIPGVLDRQDKLGGYKHKYSFEITEQMVSDCAAFTDERRRPGQIQAYLKELSEKEKVHGR